MDKAVLVVPDFKAGLELVRALESRVPISVALWLYSSDYDRLVFCGGIAATRRSRANKGVWSRP